MSRKNKEDDIRVVALKCYKAGIQTGKSFAIQQSDHKNIYS